MRPRPVTTAAPVSGSAQVAASSVHADGSERSTDPVGHVIALGELLQAVHVAIVVAGEDQAALAQTGEQAPPRVERGEQHVTQLRGGRHQPAQVRDAHAQERGAGHGDAGEEGRLPHEHAELADEVAGLDHEADPVVSAVDETDSALEDEVEVVGVARVPQQLTGLGPDHLADRLQHQPGALVVAQRVGGADPVTRVGVGDRERRVGDGHDLQTTPHDRAHLEGRRAGARRRRVHRLHPRDRHRGVPADPRQPRRVDAAPRRRRPRPSSSPTRSGTRSTRSGASRATTSRPPSTTPRTSAS